MAKYTLNRYALVLLALFIPTIIYAAPPSRIYTYTSGDTISPDEVTSNEDSIFNYLTRGVDTYADGTILNADISTSASIADSKLAQITTASKVNATAITGLASLPSGAGKVPSANLPGSGITLPSGAVFYMMTGSCPTGTTDVSTTYENKFVRVSGTQGSTGGSDTLNITEANLPSHYHRIDTGTNAGSGGYIMQSSTSTTYINTTSVGSGTLATITNPYVTCKMCQVN